MPSTSEMPEFGGSLQEHRRAENARKAMSAEKRKAEEKAAAAAAAALAQARNAEEQKQRQAILALEAAKKARPEAFMVALIPTPAVATCVSRSPKP